MKKYKKTTAQFLLWVFAVILVARPVYVCLHNASLMQTAKAKVRKAQAKATVGRVCAKAQGHYPRFLGHSHPLKSIAKRAPRPQELAGPVMNIVFSWSTEPARGQSAEAEKSNRPLFLALRI